MILEFRNRFFQMVHLFPSGFVVVGFDHNCHCFATSLVVYARSISKRLSLP